ncbi:Bromodomain-containing protein [Dipodascopsis uninucleata]
MAIMDPSMMPTNHSDEKIQSVPVVGKPQNIDSVSVQMSSKDESTTPLGSTTPAESTRDGPPNSTEIITERKDAMMSNLDSSAPLSPPIPSPPLQHADFQQLPNSEPNITEKRVNESEVDSIEEPPSKRLKSEDFSSAPEKFSAPTAPTTPTATSTQATSSTPQTPAASSPGNEQQQSQMLAERPADMALKTESPTQTDTQLSTSPASVEYGSDATLPRHQSKFALSMVRSLKRLKDAAPFLQPVDPVRLGIPDYFNIVKNPMDLSAIEKKLTGNEYKHVDQFVSDFQLMIDNCILFNGAQSKIADMARSLKASFDRQYKQMPTEVAKTEPSVSKKKKLKESAEQAFALTPSGVPIIRRDSVNDGRPKREIHPPRPRDLPYSESKPRRKKYAAELKFCSIVLKELLNKKYEGFSFPFLQPVDPVALNCPSYFKIIKKPMDLSTIQQKLNNNQYETGDEFEADIRLMFKNCYKFNPDNSPVNVMGHKLEAVFDKKWAEKPVPPPPVRESPPPPIESSSESESEEDEEDEDPGDKTISYLEQQLVAMQNQLSMMKKLKKENSKKKKEKKEKEKEKSKKSSTTSKKKSKSTSVPAPVPHVSYDMKKELSEKIMTLTGQKLNHVIKMIHESMPHLKNAGQEEIELDVDQLDPVTLMKLYNYVTKNSPSKPSSSNASKAKKVKVDEQKKQLVQAEKKTKVVEQHSSDESSSEEDDSESSSEEE